MVDVRLLLLRILKKIWIVVIVFGFLSAAGVNSSTTTEADPSSLTSPPLSTSDGTNHTTPANGNGTSVSQVPTSPVDYWYLDKCPDNTHCKVLGSECLDCKMNHYCRYGDELETECTVKKNVSCIGDRVFKRTYHCRYCYQLDHWLYKCNNSSDTCIVKTAPQQKYFSQCVTRDDVLCLGNRTFTKAVPCNWTSGYKWSTALILSITLGGFGVDRFYLGLWREGIGKLFSFGGLGVWTLVDVILIAVGYIGPHDGSLYIYPWS